jgi:hypothetical protein
MDPIQRNAFKRKSDEVNAYPFDSTVITAAAPAKAGQAAIWDDALKTVTVGTGADGGATTTDGRNMIGVFQDAWPPQSDPFSGQPAPPFLTVRENGVQAFFGLSGETYQPMDEVVLDDTANNQNGQHVRLYNPGGGDAAGDVIGKVASDYPSAGITIAGDLVEVRIRLKRNALLVDLS